MKKNHVITLLARELQKTNTGHYSYNERKHAEDILNFIKSLGILKPTKQYTVYLNDIENMPYESEEEGWEIS